MNRRSFVASLVTSTTAALWPSDDGVAMADEQNGKDAGMQSSVKLTSPFLDVEIEPAFGRWNCKLQSGEVRFKRATAAVVSSVAFLQMSQTQVRKKAARSQFKDVLGSGTQGVISTVNDQSGLKFDLAIKVYDQFAGLALDCNVQNTRREPVLLEDIVHLNADLVGVHGSGSRGTHLLVNGFDSWSKSYLQPFYPVSGARSYDTLAITIPKMVAGFLSAETSYGRFDLSDVSPSGAPVIHANSEFKIMLKPGQSRQTDSLLILFPEDLFDGLENYATAVEKWNNIHPLRSANTAWCSWYSGYGRAEQANLDDLEKAVIENAKLMAPLVPLGVDTVRVVDDSNNERYGDWNFPFIPHGMGNLAAKLRAMGRKPGVWLAPAFVSETSNVFKQHPDWLQRDSDGKLVTLHNFYGNTMHFFDASHPSVLDYLRNLFLRIRNWGFEYVMTDFLFFFGLSDHYYNPHMTRAEIYHGALKTIRQALGPEVYLLGCGAPQLASAGLVDGMRIGTDAWGESGFGNIAARYFDAGKWWLNDPDALVGNDRPVEGYRAWVTLAAMSGSVLTIGDDLAMLARDKLNILKKILPAQGRVGRPLDLFESNPSNVWFLETQISKGKSGILSLFNWRGPEILAHRIKPMDTLQTTRPVLVYDFWNDYFVGEGPDPMDISVSPAHVRSLCLTERTGRPQVLAVSNFLPQNSWALPRVTWSESSSILEGEARNEAGEYFHIAFYVPDGFQPQRGQAGGKTAFLVKQQKNVWVIPMTGTGTPSGWSVTFTRVSKP